MGFWDSALRVGEGIGTMGLSEAARAKGGWGNFLFGGSATQGMATQPQSADYQRGYLQDFNRRQAPTMDAGQSNQIRGQQNQLAQMLFNTANGTTPGAGEMAVNRQVAAGRAGNVAQAATARGADAALAMRNAARSNADLATSGAGQAAIAQLNDRTAAQNQLAGLLGTTRAQDIGVAQGNQQAQMAQQDLQLKALAQMLGVDEAALRQDLARRGLKMQDNGMFPTLLQTGGQILGTVAGGGMGGAAGGQLGNAAGGGGGGGYTPMGDNLMNPWG